MGILVFFWTPVHFFTFLRDRDRDRDVTVTVT